MEYIVVNVKNGTRTVVDIVTTVDQIITVIENNHVENIRFLNGITEAEFKYDVEFTNKYEKGVYMIETSENIKLYEISTVISFGYLFNSVKRKTSLFGVYEIVLGD